MNIQKFTQKSMQAVEGCEKLAYEYGNQEIEQEHLLYSLLKVEDSLILKLIEKMEIQKEHFVDRVEKAIAKRTKVQGGKVYVGADLNKVLVNAEDEAKQLGDEYVSVAYILRTGIQYGKFEYATAISLVRSVISLGFVAMTNHLTNKYAEVGLW